MAERPTAGKACSAKRPPCATCSENTARIVGPLPAIEPIKDADSFSLPLAALPMMGEPTGVPVRPVPQERAKMVAIVTPPVGTPVFSH